MSDFNQGITSFTLDLYKKEAVVNSDNVFMSPHSVCAALLLTLAGARGNTAQEIKAVLGLADTASAEIHQAYNKLHTRFNTPKENAGNVIAVANRAFAKIGLAIPSEYQSTTKEFYGSELELMDFAGECEASRQKINQWVVEQTRGKIQNLLPAGFIDSRSLIILVNAIYFKGSWDKKFDVKHTVKDKFHVTSDEDIEVDMMFKKDSFNIYENMDMQFSALELQYEGKDISMVILLPRKVDGFKELEEKLTIDVIKATIGGLQSRKDVIVKLPKFKMECTFELTKTLPVMGLKDVFVPGTADLSGMIENPPQPPYVSDVIHKAFVEVNEEGTEAAAATAIGIRCMSFIPPTEFIANHPFLFLIRDRVTQTILFIGRCSKPQQ